MAANIFETGFETGDGQGGAGVHQLLRGPRGDARTGVRTPLRANVAGDEHGQVGQAEQVPAAGGGAEAEAREASGQGEGASASGNVDGRRGRVYVKVSEEECGEGEGDTVECCIERNSADACLLYTSPSPRDA